MAQRIDINRLVLAYVAGSFLAGVFAFPLGGGLFENTAGRFAVGVYSVFFSFFTFGFLPLDFTGTRPPVNCWPYIIGCWIALSIWSRISSQRQPKANHGQHAPPSGSTGA